MGQYAIGTAPSPTNSTAEIHTAGSTSSSHGSKAERQSVRTTSSRLHGGAARSWPGVGKWPDGNTATRWARVADPSGSTEVDHWDGSSPHEPVNGGRGCPTKACWFSSRRPIAH